MSRWESIISWIRVSTICWLLCASLEPSFEEDVDNSSIIPNKISEDRVRKPISAFGCKPNANGVSLLSVSSICVTTLSYEPLTPGAWNASVSLLSKYGYNGISSNNSSLIKNSRYVFASMRSKSFTMCPPYIISPNKYRKSCQGTLAGALSI